MHSRRYALAGAAVGIGLPILATLMEAARHFGGNPIAAQLGSPLLWIIDTAPLVVATLAALAGARQDTIVALQNARTENFTRMADDLSSAARALLGTVSAFSAMTTETATSVKQTTTTMSGLSHTAMQAALTAETVIGLAAKSQRSSEQGLAAVEKTSAGMAQVAEEVRSLSRRVEALNGRMRDIHAIANVVSEIADSSDALAESTRAEAGRAGPAAQAFAGVVAQMRDHARDAKNAATQVKTILAEIHKEMLATLTAAEVGSRRAEAGAAEAAGTGQTIRQLAATIDESSSAARAIAAVAQHQDRGIDETLKAMNEIFRAVEDAAVATEHVAREARSLNDLAEGLKRQVGR